jgi:glycosyltransferase involved in cell wall biosynthesis
MLVSIIIPYFKSEKYIQQAINSVLNQKHKNWELIIIDDEISILSKDILYKIKKKNKNKIKILFNKKNFGAAISRNRGISIAKGKYIAFLDSDDFWNKNKLYQIINFSFYLSVHVLNFDLNHVQLLNFQDFIQNLILIHFKIIHELILKNSASYKESVH